MRTDNLSRAFARRNGRRKGVPGGLVSHWAVESVSMSIRRDECLALVGRSGCGKTTLARMIALLLPRTSGYIYLDSREVSSFTRKEHRQFRHRVRLIFQNQDAIFNPYMSVRETLDESLRHLTELPRRQRGQMIEDLFLQVGLPPKLADRYPQKLSGGQKRRISIARALIGDPDLIIGDEPLASLDVFTQNHIVDQLLSLRESRRFSLLLITHDIHRVHQLATRIAVMHSGRLVEVARTSQEFQHPYSISLFRASRLEEIDEVDLGTEEGTYLTHSCLYRRYCPIYARSNKPEYCRTVQPQLLPFEPGHEVACHMVKL